MNYIFYGICITRYGAVQYQSFVVFDFIEYFSMAKILSIWFKFLAPDNLKPFFLSSNSTEGEAGSMVIASVVNP